jgi:uncharacterized FlgJ-related protein
MKNLIVLVALLLTTTTVKSQPQEIKNFVNEYKAIANFVESMYDVPAEITLAVAALESGWGTSKAARINNNLFGIVNGRKKFDTKEDCFLYFGRLLSGNTGNAYLTKRYKPMKNCKHWREWAIGLYTCGYNPYEWYPGKVVRVVLSLDDLIQ